MYHESVSVTWRVPHHSFIMWIKSICNYLVILSGMQYLLRPVKHRLLYCRFITKNWVVSMGNSQASSSLPSDTEGSLQIWLTESSLPLQSFTHLCVPVSKESNLTFHYRILLHAHLHRALNPEIWVAAQFYFLWTQSQRLSIFPCYMGYVIYQSLLSR